MGRRLTEAHVRKIVRETLTEAETSTALVHPVDDIVSKREQLDEIKSKMRGVTQTLDITLEGLKDDIPRIGGRRGPTMRDLHGAVVSLVKNADIMLTLLEELEGLRG